MNGLHKQADGRRRSSKSIAMLKIPTLKNTLLLVPRMIGATFSAAVQVFYLTVEEGWPEEADASSEPLEPMDSEPVVGRIFWTAGVGDQLHHRLNVTNVDKRTHDFSVVAAPFQGTNVRVDIDVPTKSLPSGETLDAVLGLTIPDSLAGGCYVCSVVIHGACAQRLVIRLSVRPRQESICFVAQGEGLMRRRG